MLLAAVHDGPPLWKSMRRMVLICSRVATECYDTSLAGRSSPRGTTKLGDAVRGWQCANLRPRTRVLYDSLLRTPLDPALGPVTLTSITSATASCAWFTVRGPDSARDALNDSFRRASNPQRVTAGCYRDGVRLLNGRVGRDHPRGVGAEVKPDQLVRRGQGHPHGTRGGV